MYEQGFICGQKKKKKKKDTRKLKKNQDIAADFILH